MKNLKFNLPMWLLVLGLVFGLWGCQKDASDEINNPNGLNFETLNNATIGFRIADSSNNNLIKSKDNSIYNIDYIKIVTYDGKYVDNLEKRVSDHSVINRIYEGYNFKSKLLSQISGSQRYEKKYWKIEYADQPLFLHLSPDDIDTLVWNSKEKWIYHNGVRVNEHHAIIKNVKN